MTTSCVFSSCTTTGTRPWASHFTLSTMFSTLPSLFKRNAALIPGALSQANGHTLRPEILLCLLHGVFPVVEDRRCQHRVCLAVHQPLVEVLEGPHPSCCDDVYGDS